MPLIAQARAVLSVLSRKAVKRACWAWVMFSGLVSQAYLLPFKVPTPSANSAPCSWRRTLSIASPSSLATRNLSKPILLSASGICRRVAVTNAGHLSMETPPKAAFCAASSPA